MKVDPDVATRMILGDIPESISALNRTLESINSNLATINSDLAKLVEKVHEVGNVGSCIFEVMDRN